MGFPSAVNYGIIMPTLLLESFHLLTPLKLLTAWFFSQLDLLVHAIDDSWHEEEQTPCGRPPVPSSQMIKKTLEVMEFGHFLHMVSEEEGKQEQEQGTVCCVCLCSIERRDKVRELHNCRHAFHQRCLDKWVDQGHHTCPLCRTSLLPLMAANSDTDHESWLVDHISYLFADNCATEI